MHEGSGLSVPETRVLSLKNYARPNTKKQLRTFLGVVGYYRQFIPKFAYFSAQLTPAVSLGSPRLVSWSVSMINAFDVLCNGLCNHVMLVVPSVDDQYTLYTDASEMGIGGCLHVTREGKEHPVAFYSR